VTEQEYERLWRLRLTREMVVVIVCLVMCVLSFLVGVSYGEDIGVRKGLGMVCGEEEKGVGERGMRWY